MTNKMIVLLVLLLVFLFSCRSNVKKEENIDIKNNDLKFLINDFYDDALKYSHRNSNLISLDIILTKTDTFIGLYASKGSDNRYFIGKAKVNDLSIYVYSNYRNSIKDLYEIRDSFITEPDTFMDYCETYNISYLYKNGTFLFKIVPLEYHTQTK